MLAGGAATMSLIRIKPSADREPGAQFPVCAVVGSVTWQYQVCAGRYGQPEQDACTGQHSLAERRTE